MISTVKKEITISTKIECACTFSNCKPKIKNCQRSGTNRLALFFRLII